MINLTGVTSPATAAAAYAWGYALPMAMAAKLAHRWLAHELRLRLYSELRCLLPASTHPSIPYQAPQLFTL